MPIPSSSSLLLPPPNPPLPILHPRFLTSFFHLFFSLLLLLTFASIFDNLTFIYHLIENVQSGKYSKLTEIKVDSPKKVDKKTCEDLNKKLAKLFPNHIFRINQQSIHDLLKDRNSLKSNAMQKIDEIQTLFNENWHDKCKNFLKNVYHIFEKLKLSQKS